MIPSTTQVTKIFSAGGTMTFSNSGCNDVQRYVIQNVRDGAGESIRDLPYPYRICYFVRATTKNGVVMI